MRKIVLASFAVAGLISPATAGNVQFTDSVSQDIAKAFCEAMKNEQIGIACTVGDHAIDLRFADPAVFTMAISSGEFCHLARLSNGWRMNYRAQNDSVVGTCRLDE